MQRQNVVALLILTSLVILLVTMMPDTTVSKANRSGKIKSVPFHHLSTVVRIVARPDKPLAKLHKTLVDLLGNIVLFVPFGVLASIILKQKKRPTWMRILLAFGAGLLFSSFIETVQFWFPTRTTDVDDIIFNSSGTLLGMGLVPAFCIGREYMLYWRRFLPASLRPKRPAGVAVSV